MRVFDDTTNRLARRLSGIDRSAVAAAEAVAPMLTATPADASKTRLPIQISMKARVVRHRVDERLAALRRTAGACPLVGVGDGELQCRPSAPPYVG